MEPDEIEKILKGTPSRLNLGFRLQRRHCRSIIFAYIDDARELLATKHRTAELVSAVTRLVVMIHSGPLAGLCHVCKKRSETAEQQDGSVANG